MTNIDFFTAEQCFAESTDFTVGIEEEFAILDPETLDLANRFSDLVAGAQASNAELAKSISSELIQSEIEIRSGRGANFADALERQRSFRYALVELAQAADVKLGATGTHPWADYRQQSYIDSDHYRRVVDDLQYVARRNNTFSLHVHVGVRDLDRAIKVCDRLRPVLPLLLALSASSPFVDGCFSGLHSARSQTFTRTFPRCGIPEPFGSWQNYRRYLETLLRVDSIIEYTQVWWSVRPHLSFGTVEVRICDAQPDAVVSEQLSALIVACVAQSAREVDSGMTSEDLPGYLVEENFWRAIRYGLDGKMADFSAQSEYAGTEIFDRLATWAEPAACELGIPLMPVKKTAAQLQQQAFRDGVELADIYAQTVAQTMASYGQPVDQVASQVA